MRTGNISYPITSIFKVFAQYTSNDPPPINIDIIFEQSCGIYSLSIFIALVLPPAYLIGVFILFNFYSMLYTEIIINLIL